MDCELAEVLEFPPTEQEQLLSYLEQLEREESEEIARLTFIQR